MLRIIIVFQSIYWIQGVAGTNDVSQPSIISVKTGLSATINCSHTKGFTYYLMYWFRQYHGESMELIVLTNAFGSPDYGNFNQSKFSANKTVPERGSFTVNDVDYKDSAVYFCAVREHSVITTGQSCSGICSVTQNPPDLIKNHDGFAEIKCAHTKESYNGILWYKHSQDSGFTLMGYLNVLSIKLEAEFETKVVLSGDGTNNGSMTINSLSVSDSAVYYCAAYHTVL
ncbi:uncharacterized protein LOC131359902 [Hemibagrus wyckioides]|uniref:uncharacterized protein LOC131359902 n=1 Tax=Hemibagrus wyckioides TaxID=337641 RepID=UPI00266C81CB|nr:uncharacterized protein LOC131359902 [Hemibagrus wyckioides]